MKTLFTLLLIMSTLFSSLFGQSYDQLWSKVTTAQQKDLPRDVIKNAETIYDKASKEKNYPQLLKSWVTIVETKCDLDPDSFQIANFPPLPHKGKVQTALYNAIMGSAYLVMKDTHISEYDEETQEGYTKKARELFTLALSDKEALANESAEGYQPLINTGSDSKYYDHDLLSLLTRFVIEHGEMEQGEKATLCGEVADYYKQHNNLEGYTLMSLKKLGYLSNHEDFNLRLRDEAYTKALKSLLDESMDQETSVDVAAEYIDHIYDNDAKLDFARWAQKHYKQTSRLRKFQSIEKYILQQNLEIRCESGGLANRPVNVRIWGKNINSASLEVRKYNGRNKNNELKTDGRLVLEREYSLCDDSLSLERLEKGYPVQGECRDSITLPAGHYVYIAYRGKKQDTEEVSITSLRLLTFNLPGNQVLAQVLDNETGRPVPNALLTFKDNRDKVTNTLHSDKNGECTFFYEDGEYMRIYASIEGTDDCTNEIDLRQWRSNNNTSTKVIGRLYTDREIYRPGQTVHISGIFYNQTGDDVQVSAGRKEKITLKDTNWTTLHQQEVTTNALGSFDFDYVLPKEILPGRVTIQNGSQTTTIRVEEYKRPTFQVEAHPAEIEAAKASFSFGDTIQVEALAKAFSGVPVQGAAVHYKVESSEVSFWSWYNNDWNVLAEADTVSDDQGIVSVPVFLNPKDLNNDPDGMVRYRISFDVTDQAGETQSASYSLAVSSRSFALNVKAASEYDLAKADHHFTIQSINANHADVDVSGTYTLYIIGKENERVNQSFKSNQPIALPTNLAPGTYRLQAIANDRDGTEIAAEATFSVYNSQQAIDLRKGNASRLSNKAETRFSQDFLTCTQSVFSEQQAAEVLFSPIEEDVYAGYLILSNKELIEHKQIVIGRNLYRFTLPYDKKYGDGVSVLFWYVRNGHLFQKRVEFTYKQPEKALKLSWSTFRDKLYPGQQEEWTLTIHDLNGKPVEGAELLATMYDASLDQIAPHSWNFNVGFYRFIRSWNYRKSSDNNGTSLYVNETAYIQNNPNREFDQLTQYLHDRYFSDRIVVGYGMTPKRGRGKLMMARASNTMEALAVCEESAPMMADEVSVHAQMKQASMVEVEEPEADNSSEESAPALRSNFAETAFFYPHLLSDANGDVKISFTLPESLTEWKFMGLAHTQEVNYGQIIARAVARKDFMVQPNMPRFVRDGDRVVIAARVINQGESDIKGQAQLRFIDPETEKVVFTAQQPFAVAVGQTSSVSFEATISDKYPMLICEVSGNSGTFSDGERNYLPVLTSKKYITEAIPFYMTDKESEKRIDVSSLFNEGSPTATHRRLLLEFTEHPEWTVIEALDGIKLPEHDNAPCFAASLYANTMASRLAQSIPGFEEALLWAKEHNIDATSPLEDNQDLKEIVLNNSPWVRDALAEAEQRSRLLDLFNQNLMSQRIAKAKEKLQKLQNSDGSWSWFEGMQGSYYITLSVCQNLAMLQSDDNDVQQMLERGLKFLDEKEYEDYQYRLKHKQPVYASGSMEYLYVSSFLADRKVGKEIAKMREVYLKEIETMVGNLTIQGRSKASCVLRAFTHTKSADDFLESAVQYTITKPGMGRYYATDAAYYSWCDYRIPTQLATMRALRQSSRADRAELINEMQLWLIRQKQTQGWDSPINTIGAVQFLLESTDLDSPTPALPREGEDSHLSSDNLSVGHTFVLDGKELPAEIDTTKFLAPQLGYVRTEIDESLYSSHPTTLTITAQPTAVTNSAPSLGRAGEGSQGASQISWGALYGQYLEDMDRLHQQTTGELKVSVKLIKSSGNNAAPVSSLHVGDEVTIRVILTADRDMDFVQLRVQRPACFEPGNQLSGYRWMNGRGGYVAQHDASTDIFFDTFRKGTMTYDLTFRVDREGEYLSGVTTAQCAYAPEFSAHTGAIHITVK